MTTQEWQMAESLFHEALDMPPGEWYRWVTGACPDDPALAEAVLRMLEADAHPGDEIRRAVRTAVARMHQNLGHPTKVELVKLLAMHGASAATMAAAGALRCAACIRSRPPQHARVSKPSFVGQFGDRLQLDAVHITAPVLIAVSDKTPNEVFQRGQFPADARSRAKPPLETQLVTVPGVDETLLVPQGNEEKPKVW